MRKRFFITIFATFLIFNVCGCSSTNVETDNTIHKDCCVYEYDSNNRCTKEIYYDSDGNKQINTLTYNSDGNCVMISVHENGDIYSQPSYTIHYGFDSYGNETYTRWVSSDGEEFVYQKYEYKYNTDGLKIERVWLDQIIPNADMLTTYEYDANKNLIKENNYNFYSYASYGYYTYEYDSAGNIKRTTFFDSANALVSYCDYTYDSYGNCTKKMVYNSDGSLDYSEITEYKYDSQGNKIYEKNNRV